MLSGYSWSLHIPNWTYWAAGGALPLIDLPRSNRTHQDEQDSGSSIMANCPLAGGTFALESPPLSASYTRLYSKLIVISDEKPVPPSPGLYCRPSRLQMPRCRYKCLCSTPGGQACHVFRAVIGCGLIDCVSNRAGQEDRPSTTFLWRRAAVAQWQLLAIVTKIKTHKSDLPHKSFPLN